MKKNSTGLVPPSDPEVMMLLGVQSPRSVWKLVRQRHVPAIRINGRIFLSIAVIKDWIRQEAMKNCSANAEPE
jgi:hypothetical protein